MNGINHKEARAATIALLLDAGINYVGCKYNGGGDDGSIEELYLCHKMPEDIIQTGTIRWDDEFDTVDLKGELYSDIRDKAEDLFYPYLDRIEDWWNNDGGYGSAVIDLNTMQIAIDNNCYRTETDNYAHNMDMV